jgi:peptidyl-prolyl cis-trans isomerase C
MNIRYIVLLSALVAAGCSESNTPEAETATPVAPTPEAATPLAPIAMPTPTQPAQPALPPETVVVTVNGKELTKGEIDTELDAMLANIPPGIPAERIAQQRQMIFGRYVTKFVEKTALLAEAAAQNVTISDEEKATALERFRDQAPEGMDMDRLRSEIADAVLIEKLIETQLKDQLEVSEADLDAFIAENKASLQAPASSQASHILITLEGDATAEQKTAARERLAKIREQVVAGGDFAELAKTHSACPSAQKGGDLGSFSRGQMVKEFEEVAFTQEIGAISEIVETQFGFHLIKVTGRSEAGEMPRERVKEIVSRQKQGQVVSDYVQSVMEKATVKYGEGFEPPPPMPMMPGMPPPPAG